MIRACPGSAPGAYPPGVPPGDPATPPPPDAGGDDLEARLADPVLVAARADAPPPGEPPAVWGGLVPDGPLDDAAVDARARGLLDQM